MRTLRKRCGQLGYAILALALSPPVIGCGDDDSETSPFEGTYNVTLHTRNNSDCDGQGAPFTGGDRFFRLTDAGDSLNYYACDDANVCQSAINISKGFTEKVGNTWRNVTITTDDIRFGCDVTLTERIAQLDDNVLLIEERIFEGGIDRQEGQDCTHELVLTNRDDLSCRSFEVVTAVPTE